MDLPQSLKELLEKIYQVKKHKYTQITSVNSMKKSLTLCHTTGKLWSAQCIKDDPEAIKVN